MCATRRPAGRHERVDPRDSTSVPQPVPDYSAALTGDIKGLKLGLPRNT
jgi:Asp-tRNA(Asn)/Glu-tRNA(Gln) amidotransferase A subunit family amidase